MFHRLAVRRKEGPGEEGEEVSKGEKDVLERCDVNLRVEVISLLGQFVLESWVTD